MTEGFGLPGWMVAGTDKVTVVSPVTGTPVQLLPSQKTVIVNLPATNPAILYLPPPGSMPGEIITLEVGLDGGDEVAVLWTEGEDKTRTPEETAGSGLTDKLGAVDDHMVLISTLKRWAACVEKTS